MTFRHKIEIKTHHHQSSACSEGSSAVQVFVQACKINPAVKLYLKVLYISRTLLQLSFLFSTFSLQRLFFSPPSPTLQSFSLFLSLDFFLSPHTSLPLTPGSFDHLRRRLFVPLCAATAVRSLAQQSSKTAAEEWVCPCTIACPFIPCSLFKMGHYRWIGQFCI